MAKNRYKGFENRRLFNGTIKNMEAVNSKLYRVEIWALNDEVNRNGWKYINLEQHLSEFRDIPILTAYVKNGQIIGDGHNYDIKTDPKTGEQYASFTKPDAERIVGWVPKDANIRIVKEDGINWIVVTAYLWTWYSRELVEKIARQGSGMSVSIETLVTKEHKEGDVDVEEEYEVLGITVLGDGVAPAVAGANIQSLAALRNSMKNEVLKAASYIENPKQNKNKGVKNLMANERKLKELSENAAFSKYTVLGVTNDDKVIALLSETGAACIYARSDSDMGNIIADRIKSCSAVVTFGSGEDSIEVEFEGAVSKFNSTIANLEAENKNLSEEKASLENKVADMVKKENARRVEAAKTAIASELASCNADVTDNECKYSDEIVKDLAARVEAGEFTALEDKDGNWIGEKAIRTEVKALCMEAQKSMNKKARESEKHYVSYGDFLNKNENHGMTLGEAAATGNF